MKTLYLLPMWCGLVTASTGAEAAPDPVDVFLLAGQSNMQGIGRLADLSDEERAPVLGAFFFNGKDFEALVPGETVTARAGELGPEIGFARAMTRITPGTPICLIKFSRSGQPLHHGCDGGSWVGDEPGPNRATFYAGKSPDDPNRGRHYEAMLRHFRSGLSRLRADGKEPVIRGILWMQGEEDSKHETAAREYAKSLKHLKERLQEDLGCGPVPLVFGQVLGREPPAPRFTYRNEIRAAMARAHMLSALPEAIQGAWMVPTDAFPVMTIQRGTEQDLVHFTALGQLALGEALAEGWADAKRHLDALAVSPGCWPQGYSVVRDESTGVLTLSTPYYTVEHDLRRGGAIRRIAYPYGKAKNLLVTPIESRVRDASGVVFSDLRDSSPDVSHRRDGSTEIVATESRLLDDPGRSSGVRLSTTYEYRWGYVKIHRKLSTESGSFEAREVCPIAATLAPGLTDFGYRDGLTEQEGAPAFSFGICEWGKVRPEESEEPAFTAPRVPRYLILADPSVEGLEWFVGSDLSQWDLQLTGKRGQGRCLLAARRDPAGIALSVSPLYLADSTVALDGDFTFDSYLGMPILEGHAWKPWFHTTFNRNQGNWVSSDQVQRWAESGIQTVHCHNDGDYYDDGLFWRDGSYPPYPDMEGYDRVIEDCRRYGIRTATYFSNKELHPSTGEFQESGHAWGRKDTKGNLQHNLFRGTSEFGAQMCLRSGWLEFLKSSVDRVLRNHPLDGVYYDWNVALYCLNGLHEGKEAGSMGSGHWDIDELLDLMEWTRRRVGPAGLVIVHNTRVPMFVMENFANQIVAMEWGYQKWTDGAPSIESLPLEWSFVGARSRGVISYGQLGDQGSRRPHRLFALQALLSGVTPWPASPETFELYPALKPLGDIETYRFIDWRSGAVTLRGDHCASAAYSQPGECYLILANLSESPQNVECVLHPDALPYPIAVPSSVERVGGTTRQEPDEGERKPLDASRLAADGFRVDLPGDGFVILRVR